MTTLKELNALKRAFEEKAKTEGKKAIENFLADFFKDNPEVVAVRWQQYTPYFNDGDACEFRVNDASVKLVGGKEDDGDYEDGYVSAWGIGNRWNSKLRKSENIPTRAGLKAAVTAMSKELAAAEDTLLFAFGDHTEITVTRDSVTVKEFEHD